MRRLLVVGATAVIRHTKDKPKPMANDQKAHGEKAFQACLCCARQQARPDRVGVLTREEAYRPYELAA
ncbi:MULTISPECIES: hypothetical protein [Mesorhizobium]|uniref:hypothetical protein n=1 Tax=Mesorhizobium sp. 10.2.3 TaxID=1085775 RepID=UPI001FE4EACE|nr:MULTISPECIES: hypothetical protein [Mesorhizobium]